MPTRGGTRANPATTHGNAGITAWKFNMHGKVNSYAEAEAFMREHGVDGFAELGPHMTLIHEGHSMDDRPSGCPHCHKDDGNLTQQPKGEWCCIDCYWQQDSSMRTYAIELYSTKIVRYYPDGTFSVSSGDWATPTTRERIQAIVPDGFRVYYHDKKMGMAYRNGPFAKRGRTQPAGVLWPLDHSVRITADGTIADVSEDHS